MLKPTVLALVALASTHSVGLAQDIDIKIKVPGYTESDAMIAIDLFRRNCRPLGAEFWSDVTDVNLEIVEEMAGYRQALGWKNTIHLMLKYSDDPQVGPRFASEPGVLAGHTLHYFLGGGDKPGFFASKRSSQYLCGMAIDPKGSDLFVAVPGFRFLER